MAKNNLFDKWKEICKTCWNSDDTVEEQIDRLSMNQKLILDDCLL